MLVTIWQAAVWQHGRVNAVSVASAGVPKNGAREHHGFVTARTVDVKALSADANACHREALCKHNTADSRP